jgi:hypothetical protein
LTEIGYTAFEGCCNLAFTALPIGLTKIDVRAFTECSGLSGELTIPHSTKIAENAFKGTPVDAVKILYFL